jgi:hypothetical protein
MLGQAIDGPGLRTVVLQLLGSGQLQALADELRPSLSQAADDTPGSAAHQVQLRPLGPGVPLTQGSWQARAYLPDKDGHIRQSYILKHKDPAMAMAAREVALFWKVHVRGIPESQSQQQRLLHAR